MLVAVVADSTSGAPDPAVLRPKKLAVAMFAIFASVTALLAIVAENEPVPDPVTSPVNVIVWSPVFDPLTEVVPVTASVGVVEPEIATPLIDVAVAAPMDGVTSVGEFANTFAPVPVSSVKVAARLALVGVARNVATLAAKPVMPVLTGRPMQFVSVPLAGVPNTGAVSVGLVSVLLVSVSVPASVASVPVVGSTTVPEPAVAFALSVVVPLVDPASINFPLSNVLAPVTDWTAERTMSPEAPEPVQ